MSESILIHICLFNILDTVTIVIQSPLILPPFPDPDPCLSGPCDENANCNRASLLNGEFTCTCTKGFTGNGLQCSSESKMTLITLV